MRFSILCSHLPPSIKVANIKHQLDPIRARVLFAMPQFYVFSFFGSWPCGIISLNRKYFIFIRWHYLVTTKSESFKIKLLSFLTSFVASYCGLPSILFKVSLVPSLSCLDLFLWVVGSLYITVCYIGIPYLFILVQKSCSRTIYKLHYICTLSFFQSSSDFVVVWFLFLF